MWNWKKIAHMVDFNSKKEYRCIEMDSGNESKCYNFNDSTEICGIWCSFCTFMYFSKLFMIEKFSFSVRKKSNWSNSKTIQKMLIQCQSLGGQYGQSESIRDSIIISRNVWKYRHNIAAIHNIAHSILRLLILRIR